MRLINVKSLQLEEFYSNIPPYAILSHTWGPDEVTLQDWQRGVDFCSKKQGFSKIQASCNRARDDGYDYLWCDTNCIDKSSSAELSEAINSMFAWYHDSDVCYAYLVDVPSFSNTTLVQTESRVAAFKGSRWFTRGWTLQELLAPRSVIFFASDWSMIGTRKKLSQEISQITSIGPKFLRAPPGSGEMNRPDNVALASIAERMSWISQRQTTRIEDLSYCMLGLFDINMPLLYGEGHKAFIRFQEEVIRASNDQTIFCWTWDERYVPDEWGSLLSPSPKLFKDSQCYRQFTPRQSSFESLTYSMTNAGLSITLQANYPSPKSTGYYFPARLDVLGPSGKSVAVPLQNRADSFQSTRASFPPCPIPIPNPIDGFQLWDERRMYVGRVQKPFGARNGLFHGPYPSREIDFQIGVMMMMTIDADTVSSVLQSSLLPKHPNGWYLQPLRNLGRDGMWGCIIGLSFCGTYPDPDNLVDITTEKLVLIFFGASVEGGSIRWCCKFLRSIDLSANTASETYHESCRELSDDWQCSILEESWRHWPTTADYSCREKLYEVRIDIEATITRGVELGNGKQLTSALIRLSRTCLDDHGGR